VVGGLECKLLEKAIIYDPPARCWHSLLSSNWDACVCSLQLPGNINPMPDNLYNPYAVPIPVDPDIPVFPPVATVPPPSNPLAPYNPPMMAPACPFQDTCGSNTKWGVDGNFDCVGRDSWGFSEVYMGKYSPAQRFFNTITCSYIMKPWDRFVVPKKVQAFWRMRVKRGEIKTAYNEETITLECKTKTFSNPWGDVCADQIYRLKTPCDRPWSQLWPEGCEKAPPPANFTASSTLGEFCPFECGFKAGELTWDTVEGYGGNVTYTPGPTYSSYVPSEPLPHNPDQVPPS
jgi:hypothetical protein